MKIAIVSAIRRQRYLSITRREKADPMTIAPYILHADDTLSGYIHNTGNGDANTPCWTTIPLSEIEKVQMLPTRFEVLPDFSRKSEFSKESVVCIVAKH